MGTMEVCVLGVFLVTYWTEIIGRGMVAVGVLWLPVRDCPLFSFSCGLFIIMYRKISNIRRTKLLNLNVSRLVV